MNREDIIRMAREAGAVFSLDGKVHSFEFEGSLERFAELVSANALIEPCCRKYDQCQKVCMPRAAAAEREACAKLCESDDSMRWSGAAEAIRARGN